MRKILLILVSASLLAACASPPKPASCEGDNLRPVNADKTPVEAAKAPVAPETFSY